MHKLRKLRDAAAKDSARYAPLHPFLAGVHDDEPFWRDLPDILQAQVLVMLDNGRPTKRNPQPREAEKLFWAGTPYIRKRTSFLLFVIWMVVLTVPSLLLHDLVDEIGGWCALAWAFFSIFFFVPRLTRGSREVFALTSRQIVVSRRTMYCSIHTQKLPYHDVVSATLTAHRDGTGTFVFTKMKAMYQPTERVTYDRVRDVKGAVRVLAKMLPPEVAEDAGFSEG